MRRRGRALDGLLLVDKPEGPTSHVVCRRVQRALDAAKAGHTGTLDPLATGLLEVCLGAATRLVPYLMAQEKTYEATALLGVSTASGDREGEVTGVDPPERVAGVDTARFAAALAAQVGAHVQRPSVFSAIKVDGQRLHALARAGLDVEAPERTVQIHETTLLGRQAALLSFRVRCSKGTYVRTFAEDLARSVGLRAHLVALRRLANGARSVDDALALGAIEDAPAAAAARLIPLSAAVAHLPALMLDAAAVRAVRAGQRPRCAQGAVDVARALDADGALVALVSVDEEGVVQVLRGFPEPERQG